MQYHYIAISNADIIYQVYRNNIIIILGELYQPIILRIRFGHNNSHFNNLSQNKIHLMYVNTFCVQKLESRITYNYCLDKKLKIRTVTKI